MHPQNNQLKSQVCFLNSEELTAPYTVVEELFSYASVAEIRALLWEWLRATITGSYTSLSEKDRDEIVYLYERILKLVEASWLIHQHEDDAAGR